MSELFEAVNIYMSTCFTIIAIVVGSALLLFFGIRILPVIVDHFLDQFVSRNEEDREP